LKEKAKPRRLTRLTAYVLAGVA